MGKDLFIATLLVLWFWGVADTARVTQARTEAAGRNKAAGLPSLDANAACRDVANNTLNKTADFPGCVADERAARDDLRKEWASYSPGMHEQCLHLVTPPALPSYVTLRECLRMSRDAQKLPPAPHEAVQSPSR
jgi:hypothetical protein